MKLDDLQQLEGALYDHVSEVFDSMPDNGTTEWNLRKLELINRILGELGNVVIEL